MARMEVEEEDKDGQGVDFDLRGCTMHLCGTYRFGSRSGPRTPFALSHLHNYVSAPLHPLGRDPVIEINIGAASSGFISTTAKLITVANNHIINMNVILLALHQCQQRQTTQESVFQLWEIILQKK